MPDAAACLFTPLRLPCGAVLGNRCAKAAMSDSLGDGCGHPTQAQARLYERWAEGGVGLSIIGEVQIDPGFAETPGNLVLDGQAAPERFSDLARRATMGGAHLWPQLGHAGALAYPATSTPKGPSALDLPGLTAGALSLEEIARLPGQYAASARLAQQAGFTGVQIHAAHGFLLSQFLSPLFNRRGDAYGGSLENRMRVLLKVIAAVRIAVGPAFPIAVKLNASDQIDGGFSEADALAVLAALEATSIDLIDISGGTYFPGAVASSDRAGGGPYFVDFARRARTVTTKPLMVTGGFKTLAQASAAVQDGAADVVGLARAWVLVPDLVAQWRCGAQAAPAFPRFDAPPPEGGVTAWYTMCLTALAEDRPAPAPRDLRAVLAAYEARDQQRAARWRAWFARGTPG